MSLLGIHAAPVSKIRAKRQERFKSFGFEALNRSRNSLTSLYERFGSKPDPQALGLAIRQKMEEEISELRFYYGGAYRKLFDLLRSSEDYEELKRMVRALLFEKEVHYKGQVVKDLKGLVELVTDPVEKRILSSSIDLDKESSFHTEMLIDRYYFKRIYDASKGLEPVDQKIIQESLGYELDLFNLRWILRAKESYDVKPEMIFSYTLEAGKRFSLERLKELSYSNLNEVRRTIEASPYKCYFESSSLYFEETLEEALLDYFGKMETKYPMSIATLVKYFHELEYHTKKLLRFVEAEMYQLDLEEMSKLWQ
ncbi:V-type ATPase subunit [Guggenheimella bovis]